MDILKRIEDILKEKGLKKAEVANRLGIQRQNFNVLFKNPTFTRLEDLANTLDISTSQLLEDKEVAESASDEVCAFVRFRAADNNNVHLHADNWAEFWAIVDEVADTHPRPRKQP